MNKLFKILTIGLMTIALILVNNVSKATEENKINKYNGTESVWGDYMDQRKW